MSILDRDKTNVITPRAPPTATVERVAKSLIRRSTCCLALIIVIPGLGIREGGERDDDPGDGRAGRLLSGRSSSSHLLRMVVVLPPTGHAWVRACSAI